MEPQSPTPTPPGPEPITVKMPLDIRSLSLAVLAVLASIYMLRWAAEVLIPLMIGLVLSYALSPVVDTLARWRVPRALGAAVLLAGLIGGVGTAVSSFSDDTAALVQSLPQAVQKLRQSLRHQSGTPVLAQVQQAASELEKAAAETGAPAAKPEHGVTRVRIEQPRFNLQDYLWTGTLGLMGLMGQITVVLFLCYFLLVSGDSFRRKLVKIAGPTFTQKKITVQVLDEITAQIQNYLLVQLFTSSLVGVATGVALWAVGLEYAVVWGIAAGLLNLIPYLGMVVITGGSALVGFLQFGTLEMALAIAGISLVINTIEGNLLTPWLTSRACRMNPVVIFAGVLFWGWLWGVWGLLLGVPILMAIKVICDHVEDLNPIGELLGD